MQDSGNDGKFFNNQGQSSSFSNRKLTRLRKLRHVSDDELGLSITDRSKSASNSPDSARKSPSPGWSLSAVPKPLPLPGLSFLRRPESSGLNSDHSFGSIEEGFSGERTRQNTNQSTKSSNGSSSHFHKRGSKSLYIESANNDLRPSVHARARSTPASHFPSPVPSPPRSNIQNLSTLHNTNSLSNRRRGFPHHLNIECVNYNSTVDVSPKSAPTSVFSTSAVSPQRSKTADLFSSFWCTQDIQNWSTAEVPDLGRFADCTSPVSPVKKNAYSADHSPLHSPTRQSSQRNQISPCKFSFSLHHSSIPQNSKELPESKSYASAHPLPLPPGAISPPRLSIPSAVMHQISEKPSTSSMKSQWQKGKLIGRGTYGSVYMATNRETGALCALKEVDIIPDDPKCAECIRQLEQEIKVFHLLKHQNIVQHYGSEVVDNHFYIYLEYVHPGSINNYVREHCGAITESIVRNFTRHILCGLAYLHSTNIIHRDIKGANLLVDASGAVKLADFGMAKHLTGLSYELSLKGSPYWMAPEVMQAVMKRDANSNLALAVDIWSLGCTVIEMFTGKPPWSELEGPQAMFKVLQGTPPIPETLSSKGKDFLQCCFQRNPAKRPSAVMLLKHPFVRNTNDQSVQICKQAFSRLNLVDKSHNTVDRARRKIDSMPNSPDKQISSRKIPCTGEACQQCCSRSFNCAMASDHSPCSKLGVNVSMSMPNSHNFSPSSNVSNSMSLCAVNNHPCAALRIHGREIPHI